MAAEALGIDYDRVRAIVADTSSLGFNDVTGGSRATFASGMATIRAAEAAIQELCARAALTWGIPAEAVEWKDGFDRAADRFAVPTVDHGTLDAWRRDDERALFLLDVRDPAEYAASHLEGARSAPGGQLIQATDRHIGIRGARNVSLTDAGASFLPVVRQSLMSMETTAASLFGHNQGASVTVQATANPDPVIALTASPAAFCTDPAADMTVTLVNDGPVTLVLETADGRIL